MCGRTIKDGTKLPVVHLLRANRHQAGGQGERANVARDEDRLRKDVRAAAGQPLQAGLPLHLLRHRVMFTRWSTRHVLSPTEYQMPVDFAPSCRACRTTGAGAPCLLASFHSRKKTQFICSPKIPVKWARFVSLFFPPPSVILLLAVHSVGGLSRCLSPRRYSPLEAACEILEEASCDVYAVVTKQQDIVANRIPSASQLRSVVSCVQDNRRWSSLPPLSLLVSKKPRIFVP